MAMPPEMYAECGCAFVLQRMTKDLRPAVRRAYNADSHEDRLALVAKAREEVRAVVAVFDAILNDAPASPRDLAKENPDA